MNLDNFKGLKYYAVFTIAVLAFFVYSASVGWKWLNATPTESTRPEHSGHSSTGSSHVYRYHK